MSAAAAWVLLLFAETVISCSGKIPWCGYLWYTCFFWPSVGGCDLMNAKPRKRSEAPYDGVLSLVWGWQWTRSRAPPQSPRARQPVSSATARSCLQRLSPMFHDISGRLSYF